MLENILAKFPRAKLAHTPTPLEQLTRLPDDCNPCQVYVKRDDCTGLGMGGNKARQLEFYLGAALADGCDSVLSTGAVQSNYMRTLAAACAKLNLQCHIQLEDRVTKSSDEYKNSGNVLLDKIFGAKLHFYNVGEDESGADDALVTLANKLSDAGGKPYIIPLGEGHAPIGALGYVVAAMELLQQISRAKLRTDLIVVGSGSGMSHAGLLTGLRLSGSTIPVLGACVRRDAIKQHARVFTHCKNLAEMLGKPGAVTAEDVIVDDSALSPGYGKASTQVKNDLHFLATKNALLTDPVYSAKTFSCVFNLLRNKTKFQNITIIHTGGTPALFAYRDELFTA